MCVAVSKTPRHVEVEDMVGSAYVVEVDNFEGGDAADKEWG